MLQNALAKQNDEQTYLQTHGIYFWRRSENNQHVSDLTSSHIWIFALDEAYNEYRESPYARFYVVPKELAEKALILGEFPS